MKDVEVILLQNSMLGAFGRQIRVRAGHARNWLIPFGKAILATKENIARFEKNRAELKKKAAGLHETALQRIAGLEGARFTLSALASEEGKLYGSVGTTEIADVLKKQDFDISRKEIRMPNGVLRMIGEHPISIQVHNDVTCRITIEIVPAKKS